MPTVATVNVVESPSGEVIFSAPVDFTAPKSIIAIRTSSGSVYQRVQESDTEITIFVGEDLTVPEAFLLRSEGDVKKDVEARSSLYEEVVKDQEDPKHPRATKISEERAKRVTAIEAEQDKTASKEAEAEVKLHAGKENDKK